MSRLVTFLLQANYLRKSKLKMRKIYVFARSLQDCYKITITANEKSLFIFLKIESWT